MHAMTQPMTDKPDPVTRDAADAEWFRAPTRRELKMGAGLFLTFGVFFILMFVVEKDWSFRWALLGLGVISTVRGMWHLIDALRKSGSGRA